ncbi:MAG TPA: hypothetical protein ENF26_06480 [Methanomicrobia archaeon]|nr:hypothetical protein [Methanomicrobia archaeon]HEX59774.1 hypothetical protein [Methanomicrobia archaeon]
MPGIELRWVFLGTLIMIVVVIAFGALLGGVIGGFASVLGYLVGGMLIGRLSAGKTILEAGIAGALTVLIGAFALLRAGGIPASIVAMASLLGFLIALLGGWLGEKWQEAAGGGK